MTRRSGRRPRAPQLLGREAEDVLHHPVELADAVEPGRGRDLGERQVGVVEQAAGEVRAPAARDLGRSRADVNVEESAQVARAHPEPGRERVLGGVVERAVGDGAQRPAHELGGLDPTGHRFAIGTAAQARTKAGRLGRRGRRVRPGVARQRRSRAARAAVDPGRDDPGEILHVPVLGHRDRRIRTRATRVRIWRIEPA